MFVVTTNIYQPHLVLGPVFSFTELNSGFASNLKGVEDGFKQVSGNLFEQAKLMRGNGVIGASYQFVDSLLTSTLQAFAGAIGGASGKSDKLFLFASGTAVFVEFTEQQAAWYERLKQQEDYEQHERRRAELAARGVTPDQIGKTGDYKGRAFVVENDGRVRLQTAAGWLCSKTWMR